MILSVPCGHHPHSLERSGKMKRSTIHIGMALVLSLGLLLALLWLLGGEVGLFAFVARAAEPAGPATPGDVYCVTLVGGGPYVGCDQVFTSVQDAVDAASGGEVIKVAAGNYTGTNNYGGSPQVVYISKTVTIRGGYTTAFADPPDPDTNLTTLDAQGQGRVLVISGDISSPTVEGLRITGGDATGLGDPFWGGEGGGVHIGGAAATIASCTITDNIANYGGGGVYLGDSPSTLIGNTIISNTAEGGGGGVFVGASESDATFISNTISYNAAQSGGGLYLDGGDITFIGNTIISNTSDRSGGGLHVNHSVHGGVLTFSENTLSYNVAAWNGGGLQFSGENNSATFTGNTIVSNTAGTGGGLSLEASDVEGYYLTITLSANIIMSNTATDRGGGLFLSTYHQDGNITFVGNTISFNAANGTGYGAGGGGLYLGEGDSSVTLIGNTIFSNTAASGGGGMSLGGNAVMDNNIIADNVLTGGCGSGMRVAGNAQLRHNTIARNRGGDGSGLCAYSSIVTLTNTILVSHTVGVTATGGFGLITLEDTLWGSGAWANGTDWGGAGTIVTGTVNYWGDPDFVDPDSGDYHIGPGSAALDRGVGAGVGMDIDNEPRIYGAPDLGADEYWPPGALKRIYLPLVLRNTP
jgi:parallel beta-helix repeat protein